MRLITVNSIILACVATAFAQEERNIGVITDAISSVIPGGISSGILGGISSGISSGIQGGISSGIQGGISSGISGGISTGIQGGISSGISGGISSVIHGSHGALGSHVHGPDCVYPLPWITPLRPTYYTIPGYDLIIPAEEIDGPQASVIYNEPLPPLEPIVLQPEPLQKFIPLPVSVAPAPLPCPHKDEEIESAKTLGELSNFLHGLVSHQKPAVAPALLPLPFPPPAQPIIAPAPVVITNRPPVVPLVQYPIPNIPPPPALPAESLIGTQIVPILSRGDIPEVPAPFPVENRGGFSYKLMNTDGSFSKYGADKSTVQVKVSGSGIKAPKIKPAFFVTSAPPAFIDVTPKPIVFLNKPVEFHEKRRQGGYSYNLINNAAESKKLDQHSVKHVVEVSELPSLGSNAFFNLPTPPALASLTPVAIKSDFKVDRKNNFIRPVIALPPPPSVFLPAKSDVKVEVKVNAAPISGSGYSFSLNNGDGSVSSFGSSKAQEKVEIINRGPTIALPEPPRVFLPAKSDVQIKIHESSSPVSGSGYSFQLHNGDGSVSSFGSAKTAEKVEIINRGPTFALPEPPRVFLPAKSDVQENIHESSTPVSGNGYSFQLHNGDGSVSSFGSPKAQEKVELINRGPTFTLPEPPRVFLPAKSDVQVNIHENSTPVSGNGYSFQMHNGDGSVSSYGTTQNNAKVQTSSSAAIAPLPSLPQPPALPGSIEIPKREEHKQVVISSGGKGYSYKLVNNKLEKAEGKAKISGSVQTVAQQFQIPTLAINAPSAGGFVYKTIQNGAVSTYTGESPALENISGPSPLKLMVNRFQELCKGNAIRYNEGFPGYNYKYGHKEASATVSPLIISSPFVPYALPAGNNQVSTGKGYSYKIVNNGGVSDNWSNLNPRISSPTVEITSRPVYSTEKSVSYDSSSKSGFKFSYSSPSHISSSSGVTLKTNFVSTTVAPVISTFSEPIVVPEEGGYTYRQMNTDGSLLKVDSDQNNQVTVSVNERARGDIP